MTIHIYANLYRYTSEFLLHGILTYSNIIDSKYFKFVYNNNTRWQRLIDFSRK